MRSGIPIEPKPGPWNVASPADCRSAMCRFVMSENPISAFGFAAIGLVVQERQDLDRAGAAPQHLDHVDLGVREQGGEVLGALLGRAGDVVVLRPHESASLTW